MWKGKVCIITGSSIGIGRKLAQEITGEGGKVIINARNAERLEITRKKFEEDGFEVSAFAGDISKFDVCKELVEHAITTYGKLDVLVNNAGISADGKIDGFKPELYQKVVDVNLMGSVFMTQAALPYLKASKGSVVFIGSVAGFHGLPEHSAYSASKMALTALTESLRYELEGTGIHIGIIYVGFTENDEQKTIYDKDGNVIPQPKRDSGSPQPVEKVARKIMSFIERRRYKQTFTGMGKAFNILNRLIPGLLAMIIRYINKTRGF